MTSRVTANLTSEEKGLLDNFCKLNNCSQSAALRTALHSLDHGVARASGGSLTIEIPTSLQLRGLVRSAIKEVRRELSIKKTSVEPFGKAGIEAYEKALKDKGFY